MCQAIKSYSPDRRKSTPSLHNPAECQSRRRQSACRPASTADETNRSPFRDHPRVSHSASKNVPEL